MGVCMLIIMAILALTALGITRGRVGEALRSGLTKLSALVSG
jgi:hypothetical protein